MIQTQAVTQQDTYRGLDSKPFKMIDNYIYLYHTKTLLVIPLYPESIQDSMDVNFTSSTPMSRSAPIFSYSSSGPRTLQISLPLHRDMMNGINVDNSSMFYNRKEELEAEDYTDKLINQLQSIALPRYGAAEKMIDPPLVAVRFGNSIFCKGVVQGSVTATHEGPILKNDKYSIVTVGFTILEVDPYDADIVAIEGGFRGLRTTLDSKVFTTVNTTAQSYAPKISSGPEAIVNRVAGGSLRRPYTQATLY